MAKVSVVLCLCPVGSASSIVQARAVLVSTEVVDRENDHVCISRPSEGGITSVNVTFRSSIDLVVYSHIWIWTLLYPIML